MPWLHCAGDHLGRGEAGQQPREARLDFAEIVSFHFDTALYDIDGREDYGAFRETAIGWCGVRLCFLVFVRPGDGDMRVISFRKATKQEVRRYAEP